MVGAFGIGPRSDRCAVIHIVSPASLNVYAVNAPSTMAAGFFATSGRMVITSPEIS